MIAEREALRKGIEHLTVLFPTVVSSFDFQVENSGRTAQYKLNAQSLRLFGLHSDVNDAHRAGANRLQNKQQSVGQGATHHPIKIHRKDDGMETVKETAREPRKVERSKMEKAETVGKEKVMGRRDNVSTKSQNHQRNSGQVDLGNTGLNNLGAQKLTLRVGVTTTGTLQIQISDFSSKRRISACVCW